MSNIKYAGIWVKASERLPDYAFKRLVTRYTNIPDEYNLLNRFEIQQELNASYEIEWLDESLPVSTPLVKEDNQRIKDLQDIIIHHLETSKLHEDKIKHLTEKEVADVHYHQSLLETNRKLGERIAELKKENDFLTK